jgi:hypothetical protein
MTRVLIDVLDAEIFTVVDIVYGGLLSPSKAVLKTPEGDYVEAAIGEKLYLSWSGDGDVTRRLSAKSPRRTLDVE